MNLRSRLRFWPGLLLLPLAPGPLAWAQQPPSGSVVSKATPKASGAGITVNSPATSLQNLELKQPHDRIWSAVIVATSVERPKEAPSELRGYVPVLKKVFGYNQFEIAGSATEEIDELTDNWLLPSPVFPLSVTARRAVSKEVRGGYVLNMKVFQGKEHVADTEVKLAPGSPLFIRGPLYGKGQIIIALQVQR
jgi:hypothetical protein